jgi:hypothetical protein
MKNETDLKALIIKEVKIVIYGVFISSILLGILVII